jgi:hypothetical protein
MQVKIKSLTDKGSANWDYRNCVVIEINGKNVFKVYDGEQEDNTLYRNFNDCFSIGKILQQVFDAAKSGEELIITEEQVDDIEEIF